MNTVLKRRIWSFVVGGALAAGSIAVGIIDVENIAGWIAIAVVAFAFSSCLILNNTFITDMMAEIASWGFVRMPGLITTLDLDGLIWLLTVKLLFWVIGIILAILSFILAVTLGCLLSVFVYPLAIIRNFKGIESHD